MMPRPSPSPRDADPASDDPSDTDASFADRTIPRGESAADDDPRPSVDPEVWLDHVRVARHGDAGALERLMREYNSYACSIAGRMDRGRTERDDLNQVALEGLLLALKRFDPSLGFPFAAFATPTILGVLKRQCRDHGWQVRVPRRIHEFATAERATTDRLTGQLGRTPTGAELADAIGMSLDTFHEARGAVRARETCSMDVADDGAASPFEHLGFVDGSYERTDDRCDLSAAVARLDDRSREVVRLYYGEERSQAEIARRLGVSQIQVSRLLESTRRRLRHHLGDAA